MHTKRKKMIPLAILRKILLSLVPLVLFYLLRRMTKEQLLKRKSHLHDFDKSQIVEGEIVEELAKEPESKTKKKIA